MDGQDGIKALQMAVSVPDNSEQLAAPLFQLESGVATSSAGLACAKLSGVKAAVLDRAKEIVNAMRAGNRVKPLTEILRDDLNLSQKEKAVLSTFIGSSAGLRRDDVVDCIYAAIGSL